MAKITVEIPNCEISKPNESARLPEGISRIVMNEGPGGVSWVVFVKDEWIRGIKENA